MACVLALMLFRFGVLQVAGLGIPSLIWRDKLLLSWVAPRGIVTAAVASLFALKLDAAGVSGGGALKGLVFLTILLTVVVGIGIIRGGLQLTKPILHSVATAGRSRD